MIMQLSKQQLLISYFNSCRTLDTQSSLACRLSTVFVSCLVILLHHVNSGLIWLGNWSRARFWQADSDILNNSQPSQRAGSIYKSANLFVCRFEFCTTSSVRGAGELSRHSHRSGSCGVSAIGNFVEAAVQPYQASSGLLGIGSHRYLLRRHLPNRLGLPPVQITHHYMYSLWNLSWHMAGFCCLKPTQNPRGNCSLRSQDATLWLLPSPLIGAVTLFLQHWIYECLHFFPGFVNFLHKKSRSSNAI